jgi:tRNA(fMet)-specific endonuclease VapC
MFLDTDHLSVLDRGGAKAQRLLRRLADVDPTQVATSIISYEEQMRGWLSYGAKAPDIEQEIEAYEQLKQQLTNYCAILVLDFGDEAAREFQRLTQEVVSEAWQNGFENCVGCAGASSNCIDSKQQGF